MCPLLLGTTYIVRENGKEVGKWSENDGNDVTRYVDSGLSGANVIRIDGNVTEDDRLKDEQRRQAGDENYRGMLKEEKLWSLKSKIYFHKELQIPLDKVRELLSVYSEEAPKEDALKAQKYFEEEQKAEQAKLQKEQIELQRKQLRAMGELNSKVDTMNQTLEENRQR